jgi:hypothetical protein
VAMMNKFIFLLCLLVVLMMGSQAFTSIEYIRKEENFDIAISQFDDISYISGERIIKSSTSLIDVIGKIKERVLWILDRLQITDMNGRSFGGGNGGGHVR